MTEEEKKQFEQLKRDVEELKQFVSQKKEQQITFPLDLPSQKIIQNI
jgi:hypothetical protein